MSRALLQKIQSKTGGLWDPQSGGWLIDMRLFYRPPETRSEQFAPLTRELAEEYREITAGPLNLNRKELDCISFTAWWTELLERMKRRPDKDWPEFSSRISVFVEEVCRDFRLGDPVEFFETVSRDNRDILNAAYEAMHKGKTAGEWFKEVPAELQQALVVLGPDSQEGPAILEALDAVMPVINKPPREPSISKRTRKTRRAK